MLAHTLKSILELVPDVLPLVKLASIDKELPLDNRDSTLATALQVEYLTKVAHDLGDVDIDNLGKINAAVHMYGLEKDVARISTYMVKAAQAKFEYEHANTTQSYLLKVSSFEGSIPTLSITERSETAMELFKEAKERNLTPSDDVLLYSGNAFLSKEAAVKALAVRYDATQNTDFVKIASTLGRTPDAFLSSELLVSVSDTVCEMDKLAGLHFKGHNFYKESFFVKEADYKSNLSVRLCGKQIPYECLERVGRTKIASYLGEDIAQEMDGGPMNFKNVVETLPLDLQHVLNSLVKNV
jgi:hypothetical protein